MSDEDDRKPARTVFMPSPGGAVPGAPPPASPAPAAAPAPAYGGQAPAPGGRAIPPAGLGAGLAPAAAPVFEAADARPGVNPLVDAASDLLDLVVYLKRQALPLDIAAFREKARAAFRLFERRAAPVAEPLVVQAATYVLAATIDDTVLASPWGHDVGYARATLVGDLYEERIGGERFFQYLDEARADVDRRGAVSPYGDLLELMYVCLSLGFQGVYRTGRRNPQELEDHRLAAFEALRRRRDGFAAGLSPRWRGVETRRKPIREMIPAWLAFAVSLAITAAVFFGFSWRAGDVTSPAVARATTLPPLAEVEVAAIEPPPPEPPAPPPAPPQEARVAGFLSAEIAEGLVEVLNDAGGDVRIRIAGAGMFRSGRADLLPRYEEILVKVARALRDEPGPVLIEGHSDAQPISNARFRDNYALSAARAEAVRRYLAPILQDPDRMRVEGLGANVLLDTAQPFGAVNRRVELVLSPEGG